MHKHLSARVVAAAVIFVIASLGVSFTHADSSLPWLTSTLSIQKQDDITSLPSTLGGNGNIDCSTEDSATCSVPTNYGVASSNSSVRLNSSSKFLPVLTQLENRQRYFPVTNSSEAISFFSGPPYGSYLAFNYNFSSSATLVGNLLQGFSYQITKPPDGKLMDKAKHLLAGDSASISYSENGRWMVISDPNAAILRINLETFEVLPFAAGLNYTIGLDPSVKTAITNDGRYAIVASKNFNVFKLYDLSTCASVPDTINSAVSCQSRDLGSFMKQAVAGYSFVANARFMNDDSLAVYAVYLSGSVNKTARFLLSDNGTTAQIDYLALGDSYISGEGAFDYMGGTDTESNKCHLSFLSYPNLIGQSLSYNSYHNVACSGAVTNDVINTGDNYKGQADNKQITRSQRDSTGQTATYLSSFMPGYIDQLEFVKTYQPKTITLSVGGNDMGFAQVLYHCVSLFQTSETCYSTYEDRLELVRLINQTLYPRLVRTYQKLQNAGPPGMRIYVIGYPQIAKPGGDCALNVHLNSDEVLFSQELINYLDSVIQIAAAKTGVYYVDTQDAFDGHRLCEAGPGSIAMNGLTIGNDRPRRLGGPIADESYHPNSFGYQLLENTILSATHNLTNPMPAANLSVFLPSENGLVILNVDKTGRAVNTTEFDADISADLAFQQVPLAISIAGDSHDLAPSITLRAEIHSTPVVLGSYATDSNGNLNSQVTIPSSVAAGYHTLHFYGTDLTGQPIDIYKGIYVGVSTSDLDGNGIDDSSQKCIGVTPSGQDFDKDGIDDACDANITQPPFNPPTPETTDPTPDASQNNDLGLSVNLPSTGGSQQNISISTTTDVKEDPQIFVPSSDSIGSVAGPSVLSASIAPTTPKSSLDDGTNDKYIFPGILTMLTGTIGLIFKRWLV